jgi:hypothetical protein
MFCLFTTTGFIKFFNRHETGIKKALDVSAFFGAARSSLRLTLVRTLAWVFLAVGVRTAL